MAFSYLMIGTNDLARSRLFYDAVFATIGGKIDIEYPGSAYCYLLRDGGRVWLASPYDGAPATPANGTMIGYDAGSVAGVHAAHAAALDNGGSDEGAPGVRPDYGPEFYGGYVRDPDGNKMSFIFNQPAAG
jgi:catechol 2,3-dioxygenase-like lactoylglutathione lyase family enzyme